MAKQVRLNRKSTGFSVFEVDNKGNYLRVIDPSAHLNNGRIELSGCLYDGRELFREVIREVFFKLPKVTGFTIAGYSVNADDYLLSCNVPLQLIEKSPGFQEYRFIR